MRDARRKVIAAHKQRRRRVEFLDFMNEIVAAHPDTAIPVVLDGDTGCNCSGRGPWSSFSNIALGCLARMAGAPRAGGARSPVLAVAA